MTAFKGLLLGPSAEYNTGPGASAPVGVPSLNLVPTCAWASPQILESFKTDGCSEPRSHLKHHRRAGKCLSLSQKFFRAIQNDLGPWYP